jgi:hypothetical protein
MSLADVAAQLRRAHRQAAERMIAEAALLYGLDSLSIDHNTATARLDVLAHGEPVATVEMVFTETQDSGFAASVKSTWLGLPC